MRKGGRAGLLEQIAPSNRRYYTRLTAELLEDSITNNCPTDNNTIDCSECKLECKLRFETKNNSVEFPPEALQSIIYY